LLEERNLHCICFSFCLLTKSTYVRGHRWRQVKDYSSSAVFESIRPTCQKVTTRSSEMNFIVGVRDPI